MCRLMAFVGQDPMLLADVVLWPDRSIIKQSFDARERLGDPALPMQVGVGSLNADGFGIGWFPDEAERQAQDPSPCVFTSVTPAWNNQNLARLSTKITSSTIFAHVRAAYPGMPVSENNCHPFCIGRYLWMHNGVVGGFCKIKRELLGLLSDEAYNSVQSFHSDSAVSFALFLHHLWNISGCDVCSQQPPSVLLQAMEACIGTILSLQAKHGVTNCVSMLNFVVSDGVNLIATRFVNPPTCKAASLYYAEGAQFRRSQAAQGVRGNPSCASSSHPSGSSIFEEGAYELTHCERGARVVIVASEPITGSSTDWVSCPPQTALIVTKEKGGYNNVMRSPLSPLPSPQPREVAVCLEAISRGVTVKSRQWVGPPPSYFHHRPPSRVPSFSSIPVPQDAGSNGPANSLDSYNQGLYSSASHHAASSQANGFGRAHGRLTVSTAHPLEGDVQHVQLLHQQQQQQQQPLTRLCGHAGAVLCIAVDEERELLHSSSTDCTIKTWSLVDSKCVGSVHAGMKPVTHVQLRQGLLFSSAGRRLRIWNWDDSIGLYCVHALRVGDTSGNIRCLLATPSVVFLGCQDAGVRAYKMDVNSLAQKGPNEALEVHTDATPVCEPDYTSATSGHVGPINALAASSQFLCSASSDAQIRVWNADNLTHVRTLRGHRGSVLCLQFVGTFLVSGGRDNTIRVWDSELDWLCRSTLTGHKDDVYGLAVLHPSKAADSGHHGEDMQGASNAGAKGQQQNGPSDSSGRPQCCALLASASADGSVRLWSTATWVTLTVLAPPPHQAPPPTGNIFSPPPGSTPRGTSESGTPPPTPPGGPPPSLFPDLQQQQQQQPMQAAGKGPGLAALTVAITGTSIVAGFTDGQMRMWSCAKEQLLATQLGAAEAAGEAADTPLLGASSLGSVQACVDVHAAAQAAAQQQLEKCLHEFVRIKSVSSSHQLQDQCLKAAKFISKLLESLGAEVKLVRTYEDKNPVVIGRLGRDASKPTIAFYGHYDVQPAEEPDWATDPFECNAINDYLYGRGCSDNKGPCLAFIFAVKDLVESAKANGSGGLPLNICFIFEGEEENGSVGFREALTSNYESWLAGTQLIIISNTNWVGENQPCLTYGMRGMISLSIQVSGPQKDLHSGNDGGVFCEPMMDLVKTMSTLLEPGRTVIRIPDFYEHVAPGLIDLAWQSLEQQGCQEFNVLGYKQALGVPSLVPLSEGSKGLRELLERRWSLPSLSIVDLKPCTLGQQSSSSVTSERLACYRFGPTRFSVVPKTAVAKISVRFVPRQDPNQIVHCLQRHIESEFSKLGSSNHIRIVVENIGNWWEADAGSQWIRLAEQAIEKEWGSKPLYVREGGTMPVAAVCERILKAPAIMIPLGQSSDSPHLANERIRRKNLMKGKVGCLLLQCSCFNHVPLRLRRAWSIRVSQPVLQGTDWSPPCCHANNRISSSTSQGVIKNLLQSIASQLGPPKGSTGPQPDGAGAEADCSLTQTVPMSGCIHHSCQE